LAYACGAIATHTRNFEAVRTLWSARLRGVPLPAFEPTGVRREIVRLAEVRDGVRPRLAELDELARTLSTMSLVHVRFPGAADSHAEALGRLADFSWLVSMLATVEGVVVTHWWKAVDPPVARAFRLDAILRRQASRALLERDADAMPGVWDHVLAAAEGLDPPIEGP
jgi:hypothetical protein